MLKRSSILAGVFLLPVAMAPTPASADTIAITAGALILQRGTRTSTLHMEGPRGFTMDSFNPIDTGSYLVTDYCSGSPDLICLPGDRIPASTGAVGSDLPAVVTVDGLTFTTGIGSDVQGSALIDFAASFVAPPFTSDHATARAPFTFFGGVAFPEMLSRETVTLVGRGTLSVDLALVNSTAGPRWNWQRASYDFQSPDAVPEPATLVLVGSGIAGCLMRRRRHKKG
jgi:hypothetical protein